MCIPCGGDLENDFGGDALARHYEEGHPHN